MKWIKDFFGRYVNLDRVDMLAVHSIGEFVEVRAHVGQEHCTLYRVPFVNRAEQLAAVTSCGLWLDDFVDELKEAE